MVSKKAIKAVKDCLEMWEWIQANRWLNRVIRPEKWDMERGDVIKRIYLESKRITRAMSGNCFLCEVWICICKTDCPIAIHYGSCTQEGYTEWCDDPFANPEFEEMIIKSCELWLEENAS